MGKNQAYKAMQRAKMAAAGGPEDIDDGMMDGSFHSPEWHAARLASLQTSHTVTWDEFNKRQKEAEKRRSELDADEARRMKEYRAQLDAERASKLARGRNHAEKKSSDKGKKDKDKNGRNNKKVKHLGKRRRDRSVSDPDSDSASSSDDERHISRKERSKFKKLKREKSVNLKANSPEVLVAMLAVRAESMALYVFLHILMVEKIDYVI